MNTTKLLGISIAIGAALTLVPFGVPSWKWAIELADWPLLLVHRHASGWLPPNAGERAMSLLLINVAAWSVLACLGMLAGHFMFGRHRESRLS
jgi:hypothetical protein